MHPYVCLLVRFGLLKGKRTKEAIYKGVTIPPCLEDPSMCPVVAFLALVLLDGAFADASRRSSPPSSPLTAVILSSTNPTWPARMSSVGEEWNGDMWHVSHTNALPYDTYLRHLGRLSLSTILLAAWEVHYKSHHTLLNSSFIVLIWPSR